MTHTRQEVPNLKLCDCDGFWHVECSDGITRYVDVVALLERINKEVIGRGMHIEKEWLGECGFLAQEGVNKRLAEQRKKLSAIRDSL